MNLHQYDLRSLDAGEKEAVVGGFAINLQNSGMGISSGSGSSGGRSSSGSTAKNSARTRRRRRRVQSQRG